MPAPVKFDAESNNYNFGDEMNEELIRTPSFIRGNKFFGIPLTDSAATTPRWAIRCPPKKSALDAEEGGGGTGDQSAPTEPEGGQARLDRKSLMDLYMELDEERSASAVAANNAMAMITRLQAEKASVQMEALQYQRMMEEQAEYDEEAIQLLRDDLKKKDRQVKYLENEIEAYRIRYGDIMEDGFVMDEVDDDGEYQMEASEPGTPSYGGLGGHTINGDDNSGKNQSESVNGGGGGGGEGVAMRPNKFGGLRRLKHLELESDDETEQESRMNEILHLRARVRALEEEDDFFRDDDVIVGVENGSEKGKLLSEISENLQKLRQDV